MLQVNVDITAHLPAMDFFRYCIRRRSLSARPKCADDMPLQNAAEQLKTAPPRQVGYSQFCCCHQQRATMYVRHASARSKWKATPSAKSYRMVMCLPSSPACRAGLSLSRLREYRRGRGAHPVSAAEARARKGMREGRSELPLGIMLVLDGRRRVALIQITSRHHRITHLLAASFLRHAGLRERNMMRGNTQSPEIQRRAKELTAVEYRSTMPVENIHTERATA